MTFANGLLEGRAAPMLPDGLAVYAVGDIHGRADLLARVLQKIDADIASATPHRPVQIFLGDYIDRGPSSRAVVDLLIERSKDGETVMLKGNHESMLLQTMDNPQLVANWLRIGGLPTLKSYGVSLSGEPDRKKCEEVMAAFASAMPPTHHHFFADLKPAFSCGDFFFTHAGAKPGIDLKHQSEEDLMWIRDEFLESAYDFKKFIVHGHTPVQQPDFRPNRINIDTGAYATNNLTLLKIEGGRMLLL
jgi:serine/threonine protein phosphatase 1